MALSPSVVILCRRPAPSWRLPAWPPATRGPPAQFSLHRLSCCSALCGTAKIPIDSRGQAGTCTGPAAQAGPPKPPVEPKPPPPRTEPSSSSTGRNLCVLHALNDHLCNSIAAPQLDRRVPVRIEQCHRDFSAVAGVHRAGGVHNRQSVLRGEAGPGVDQRNEAIRERNRNPCRYEAALPRREDDVLAGAKVGARVARVRVRRRLEPVVEHLQLNRQGGRSVLCLAGRRCGAGDGGVFFSHSPSL